MGTQENQSKCTKKRGGVKQTGKRSGTEAFLKMGPKHKTHEEKNEKENGRCEKR